MLLVGASVSPPVIAILMALATPSREPSCTASGRLEAPSGATRDPSLVQEPSPGDRYGFVALGSALLVGGVSFGGVTYFTARPGHDDQRAFGYGVYAVTLGVVPSLPRLALDGDWSSSLGLSFARSASLIVAAMPWQREDARIAWRVAFGGAIPLALAVADLADAGSPPKQDRYGFAVTPAPGGLALTMAGRW
jgi:hypothetical protein